MPFDLIHRPLTVAEVAKFQQIVITGRVDYEWLVAFVASRLAPPGATREELMGMPYEEFMDLVARIVQPAVVPSIFAAEPGDA